MKKPFVFILCILLAFAFVACADTQQSEVSDGLPPAFSILQKQTTVTKQGEKGNFASFTKEDFDKILGSGLSQITLKTLPDPQSGTLMFSGKAVNEGQTLAAESLGYLKFIPNASTELASFCFTCDSVGFEDVEIKCDIVFTDSLNSPPVALDSSIKTVEGIACGGELCINEPNGDSYTVNVITYPREGFISVSESGSIIYYPEEGFSGSDAMVYTVTDRFGAVSETATLKIEVEKNESGIKFADMQDDMLHLYAHRMCSNDVMVYRYENGNYYFDPEAEVTRLEFLVMLMNVSGQDTDIVAVADSVISDDTGLSSGLKGYLSAAAEKGIIRLENGSFSPKEAITVEDAAYMLAAALDLPNTRKESEDAGATEESFSAMLAASDAGFFEVLEPEKTLNKAETAELLCRVEDYMTANNMTKGED